ncbi:MAG: NAD(P)-dependent alcohol dehydrogenase [Candidatus Promineifilaceae bacterium]
MKAAIFNAYGSADELQIADLPIPVIQSDELLVKVHASAMNPKEVFIRKGRFKHLSGDDFPQLGGFDFAGEVVEVGDDVAHLAVGDAVYGMLDGWAAGTHAEYYAAKGKGTARMAQGLSFTEAAAMPLAMLTAYQALLQIGRMQPNQRVLVNGASGGVGTFAVQIAKAFGASVTAVCSYRNIDLVKELGADKVIDYTAQAVLAPDDPYDIFFDAFGNFEFGNVQHLLTPQGFYISTVLRQHIFRDQALTQHNDGQKARLILVAPSSADLDALAPMIERGEIRPIIDKIYPLDQIADAHRHLETKRTRGKVVVQIV